MRAVFFIPPLSWQSGGLANLYSFVRHTHALQQQHGRKAVLCSLRPDIVGLAPLIEEGIPFIPLNQLCLNPDDIWVVPESHPNALAPGLAAKARTIVYVQNWYYMLSSLPENVFWQQLPVEFLAVSHPVAWFIEHVLRLPVWGILPPVIAPCFFEQEVQKKLPIRIAYMPRKNGNLMKQMQDVALAHLGPAQKIPLEWVPLHKLTVKEVAKQLARCHIYLASGFPEGFGLPPAESMAAGCLPVGFTGFGGWEYMRPATGVLPSTITGTTIDTYIDAAPHPLPTAPCPASGATSHAWQTAPNTPFSAAPHTPFGAAPGTLTAAAQKNRQKGFTSLFSTLPALAAPCPLPYALQPNGLYVADGDCVSGGLALAAAITAFAHNPETLHPLLTSGKKTALLFTQEQQYARLHCLWKRLNEAQ